MAKKGTKRAKGAELRDSSDLALEVANIPIDGGNEGSRSWPRQAGHQRDSSLRPLLRVGKGDGVGICLSHLASTQKYPCHHKGRKGLSLRYKTVLAL